MFAVEGLYLLLLFKSPETLTKRKKQQITQKQQRYGTMNSSLLFGLLFAKKQFD